MARVGEERHPGRTDASTSTSTSGGGRLALVLPILALTVLFLAALGYPLLRPALVGGPEVVSADIAPTEPTDDALVLEPDRMGDDLPALAKALDLALETGELRILDAEAASRIAHWFETVHGVEHHEIVVEWRDAFFVIQLELA